MTFHSDNITRNVNREPSFVITLAVVPSVAMGMAPTFG